jgi:hypothetical protein
MKFEVGEGGSRDSALVGGGQSLKLLRGPSILFRALCPASVVLLRVLSYCDYLTNLFPSTIVSDIC